MHDILPQLEGFGFDTDLSNPDVLSTLFAKAP